MENNESPYLLLTWLQSGSEEMQLSALEQLCLALLQYETNEGLVKFYPPSVYVPMLSCLCQDFDISYVLLEAIIRTLTYYMQAVPHEVINSLVNTKGTLMAICMRLENPNMEISIESDLTQQIVKLLEELCKRDTKSLSIIGGASYIINFMSKSHHILHLDTIKSGFYILYKIIDKIDPNDQRLSDWFEFLSKFLKHADNRIVEYSLHCLLAIIKLCNERKITTEPLGIEKIVDDLLEMIVMQLKLDNEKSDELLNRIDSTSPITNNKIGLSRTIIDLILCIIRGSTQFLCNLLVNNKLSDILLEIISQYDGAYMSIVQLIEGIWDQIIERISYHSNEYLTNFKVAPQMGFRMIHGRIISEDMLKQYLKYHDCLMKAISDGNLGGLKELLLSTDFDPKYKDKWGQTPLNWASALGFSEGAHLLFARGMDPNSGEKASSFHYAASQGHVIVIETLLKNEGLNVYMKDCEGLTVVDRMKQFIENVSKNENSIEMKNLISMIESHNLGINAEILLAKEYFVKRMTPVLINLYFKSYKNSSRLTVLELLNKVLKSCNIQDHLTLIKEKYQNDALPYHLAMMMYRVLLQDTGENVLEVLKLFQYLISDKNNSKIYLNWFYRMGIKDILEKSIEKFSSFYSTDYDSKNDEKIIPLTLDLEFSEYKIVLNNLNGFINLNQPYYWGDWNIINGEEGLNIYNEYCYVFVLNNGLVKCLNTFILIRKDVELANISKEPQKKCNKNQLFTNFTKNNDMKYINDEKLLSSIPDNYIDNSANIESDYEAMEIINKTVTYKPDLIKQLLKRYSLMLVSLSTLTMPLPFPKLVPGKKIIIKNLTITSFSNHLKIRMENEVGDSSNLQTNTQNKYEIADKSLSDENEFIEISINKLAGCILRSSNQIIYKTGPLNKQGGFKRIEILKSFVDKNASESYTQENPLKESICYRIVINGKKQLALLNTVQNVSTKFFKNVSLLINAVNNKKDLNKYLLNISKLISSELTKPTPYELYKSQFLTALIKLLQDEDNVSKFVQLFQANLPKLTKMIIQLLNQIENLSSSHHLHSFISDHYLTRAFHVKSILKNCHEHNRCDVDPIPDLSDYNFLVMPLASPINIKKSLCNLLQKLPWYRANKMSFNSIRQLLCTPYNVEIKFDEFENQGGFFQWLGTNGYHNKFMNPLKLNLITLSMSENSSNTLSNLYSLFVHRNDVNKIVQNKNYASVSGPLSFITIQLQHPLGFIPTQYSLGKPMLEEANLFTLQNWQLMASIDGINWDILSTHENDHNLIESENGKYMWPLNINVSVLNKVQPHGWRYFKIQKMLYKSDILEIGNDFNTDMDCEDKLISPENHNLPLTDGFFINYLEFYGTAYAVTDAKKEEIQRTIDEYISKFKVGTLVQLSSDYEHHYTQHCVTGRIMHPIRNGTVLVEWNNESGKTHNMHKMGALGQYELILSTMLDDNIVEFDDQKPKTFTESFLESKSSFEIHPESHEDIRNSFQDSISWIIDPNISVPLRTSSLSSQKPNRFSSFFNKENLVETITNKEKQSIYKKRKETTDNYKEGNTFIKCETEDMDLRYDNSDEDNFHLENKTARPNILNRMEYLDGCSIGSKPTIQSIAKSLANNIEGLNEQQKTKTKVPEESKRNFSLSKDIKRKGGLGFSDGRRDALKIKDNLDDVEMSDDSEYFEISQDPEKYIMQNIDNENKINKSKPSLDKILCRPYRKNQKYNQKFNGIREIGTKFKTVTIGHTFPGLVQPVDHKPSQIIEQIRSNVEIINYRQHKTTLKTDANTKVKYFGYDLKQFRMKLEIQVSESIKSNFNFQKPIDLAMENYSFGKLDTHGMQITNKKTFEFLLNTESQNPIVNSLLGILPFPDPILNTYPLESISQSWHSQFIVYYGFCGKNTIGNCCKNCFFQKKLETKPKINIKTSEEITTIINVISRLKEIQSKIKDKSPYEDIAMSTNKSAIVPFQWNDSCFISHQICKTILNQLEDVWGLLSKDTLSQWVIEWPQKYPFIFSYEIRVDILNAYWLGSSRSIHWLQQRIKPNVDYIRPTFRDDISSPFNFLGRLKKHIAHVPRPFYFGNTNISEKETRSTFWLAVKDLFQYHARNKEELEIQFELEEGTGLGPTLEFMNILSMEFMRIDNLMWIHNDFNISDSEEYVYSENGLFPFPWPSNQLSNDILERFHILGIFLAKCLQDNRRIDIPFSETFFKLLKGDNNIYNTDMYLEDFINVYPMRGRFLKSLNKFCKEKRKLFSETKETENQSLSSQEKLKTISMDTLGSTFENLCIDMEFLPTTKAYGIEPFSLFQLKDHVNNEERTHFSEQLTEHNAERYLEETLNFAMNNGIRKQINTMKDGFNEVFPIKILAMFTSAELKQLLCGEQDIKWTLEDLYQFTEPTQGYTKTSQNYRYFIEVLEEMNQAERKMFVQFITGSTSLPPGGLKSLKPRLTVVKKNLRDGGPYPSVNTCMHYLKLPEYISKYELKSKLMDASRQHGFHLN